MWHGTMDIQNGPENVHDNGSVYGWPLFRIVCIDVNCIPQIGVRMWAACARPLSLQHNNIERKKYAICFWFIYGLCLYFVFCFFFNCVCEYILLLWERIYLYNLFLCSISEYFNFGCFMLCIFISKRIWFENFWF